MQKVGQYQIPAGYKRKPNIDRILFYHPFDQRIQNDYISFLQTERELEIKYRNRYTEICEGFKGEQPKDKDWALSTHLYRAINERKSSSSYEGALKDYWLLCRLKEDYYELEKAKGLPTRPPKLIESPRPLPPISPKSKSSSREFFSTLSPGRAVISQAPNGTYFDEQIEVEPPLYGMPKTVYSPKSPNHVNGIQKQFFSENGSFRRSLTSRSSHKLLTEKSEMSGIKGGYRPLSDKIQTEQQSSRNFDSVTPFIKPTMQVSPVTTKLDQQSMAAQNKHLRDLLQTQTEEIMSLRNLDRENQDIVTNLKNRLSSCTCEDNPESVDYTMNTSSAEIAQRFVNIYDSEYKTALEILTSRHLDRLTEDVALYSLMEIIKRAYNLCTTVAAEQVENMKSLLVDQVLQPCVTQHSNVDRKVSTNDTKRLHSDAERLSKLFRKRHCTVTVTNLIDKFNEELEKTSDYKTHLNAPEVTIFVEKCLQAIWFMCNQDPPMTLEWPEQGDTFDTTLYKYFKGKGFNINFPVWPAVLMYHKGPVLCKGFAVPM